MKVCERTSEIMMQIGAGYLCNNCQGCPFYGKTEWEIPQYCDSVPLNCCWMRLHQIFIDIEANEYKRGNGEVEGREE
jgi:hypothetical protein